MAGPVDTFLKISVAVSLLGAAGSVGYYYAVYLPARDAQMDRDRKLESARAEYARQAEQNRIAAERRDAEARQAAERREEEDRQAAAREATQAKYRNCLRNAREDYSANWAQACKRIYDNAVRGNKDCLSAGTAKSTCDLIYSTKNYSPDCTLSRLVGTDIEDTWDKAKKRCLDESRAGLQ
ncbi:hypothetical protein MTX26_15885 [Bradyrhizobium sp. ISRA443]|uniref:hypothetical protein n=1 Tax=unclassified Bradyrhizobium TaxID=2631580 RepID=UPI00247B1EA7|nr:MULTISPECIES: hypothetical protein [unclassified Bradyrhizobium]WGR91842.1 hypothetical protein MTX20_26460 [Bradyrhizobium sp. ISRA435]WGS02208.1 hypothetical protein MTX23_15895 [Bradyrhizobium sp. ISRA436]WGS09093.1 hypothetical protein MTX18_15885 [Bradyrhizobium sp. ISRA437]WGS15982.1 hypothetical protein MTX26_15885 [Bradyrhizobium sp. ISRA443]